MARANQMRRRALFASPVVLALTVNHGLCGSSGGDFAPPPRVAPPPVMVSPIVVDVFFSGIQAILSLLDPTATVVSESINKEGQEVTGIKLGTPGDALNFENQAVILSNMTPKQQMDYIDNMNAQGHNAK